MSTRVSRRTVAQGAAWSVPVIAVGAAAPAMAASGCPTLRLDDVVNQTTGSDKHWTVHVTVAGWPPGGSHTLVVTVNGIHTGSVPVDEDGSYQVKVDRQGNSDSTARSITYIWSGWEACPGGTLR